MRKLVRVSTMLLIGTLLAPCFSTSVKATVSVSSKKETKYKKDDSTEVLIDSKVKGKIVKVLQHGDHYHVYTSEGKEFITYDITEIKEKYPNLPIGEYVGTHEDNNFQGMEEGKKTEESEKTEKKKKKKNKRNKKKRNKKKNKKNKKSDKTKKNKKKGKGKKRRNTRKNKKNTNKKENKNKKKSKVKKKNKNKKKNKENKKQNNKKKNKNKKDKKNKNKKIKAKNKKSVKKKNQKKAKNTVKTRKNKKNAEKKIEKLTLTLKEKISKLNIIGVLGADEVDRYDIIKILRHGDHYHIYDSKGNEGIVYSNPKELYPNATFGEYVGSHGDHKNDISQKNNKLESPEKTENTQENNQKDVNKLKSDTTKPNVEKKGSDVISILRHGDHYHVYTADGHEYITYSDPSSMYPDVPIGTYTGSHGEHKTSESTENNGNSTTTDNQDNTGNMGNNETPTVNPIDRLHIVGTLGGNPVDRYNIVKILKHEDHYHIYDANGNEGVVYENPRHLYPNATFGEYVGNHGDNQSQKPKEIKWPEGITRIVDHGDHWHLYKGDVEIAVVHENPKEHYPNAEYIDERPSDNSKVQVEDNEIFGYNDVEPALSDSAKKYLDDNLKKMENFGSIVGETPVYGSDGAKENIFYWLHGNHYHAITIKQIIQNQKAGMYGDTSAREIVAALKYIVEKRKKIANENSDLKDKIEDEIEKELKIEGSIDLEDSYLVEKYLIGHYGKENIVINQLGNEFTISDKEGNTLFTLNLSDFTNKNGKVEYKGSLPELKIEKKPEPTEDTELKITV